MKIPPISREVTVGYRINYTCETGIPDDPMTAKIALEKP
jgi:hypothetical protein